MNKIFNFKKMVPAISNLQIDPVSGTILPVFGNDIYFKVAKNITLSASGRQCVNILSKFYAGGGIVNKMVYNLKINETQTFDNLHNDLCKNLAYFNTAYLLLVFNPYTRLISKMYCLETKHTRLSVPDSDGVVNKVIYNPTIYSPYSSFQKRLTKEYQIFNNTDNITFENFEQVIIIDNKDVLDDYYATPNAVSCLADLESDSMLSQLLNTELNNGFMLGGFLNITGNPDENIITGYNDDEPIYSTAKEELNKLLQSLSGVENAGAIIPMWNNLAKFEPFISQTTNNKELIKNVSDEIRERIAIAFDVVKILANISIAGKLGSSSEFKEAVFVQNEKTKYVRYILEGVYKKIAPYLGINDDDIFIENLNTNLL